MKKTERTKKEPLFHIVKRDNLATWYKALLYAAAIFLGLLAGGIICSLFSEKSVVDFFKSLISGAVSTSRRAWQLLQSMALLLGVSLALAPAFKMKFWNLGGNGQILMGCLAYVASMFYFGGKLPDLVVMVIGIVAGIVIGAVWVLIPALFKAFFNTNAGKNTEALRLNENLAFFTFLGTYLVAVSIVSTDEPVTVPAIL